MRNGLLPRHETGIPGEAIFRSHPRASPPLSVVWYSKYTGEYHTTNVGVHTCIPAPPEMVPRRACACCMGCWGDPNSSRVPPPGRLGRPGASDAVTELLHNLRRWRRTCTEARLQRLRYSHSDGCSANRDARVDDCHRIGIGAAVAGCDCLMPRLRFAS